MAKVIINAGICGFVTTVIARVEGEECVLTIDSDCPHVREMAERLGRVDPLREISWRGDNPLVQEAAAACLPHAACPVPAGIVKAIEVAAGLALPKDAGIVVSAD